MAKKELTKEQKRDLEIKMVSAVNQALACRKTDMDGPVEKIMGHVVKFASPQKNDVAKFCMISAASKALSILERNPKMTDKEVIAKVMPELRSMIDVVAEDHLK